MQEFQTATAIISIARQMPDDLPDGMAEQLGEAWDEYKGTDKGDEAKQALADEVKEICSDWGFPFS